MNNQIGWICGADNTVLKTVDGGTSWRNVSSVISNGSVFVSITFIDDNVGWISSNSGEILRTTDGGISWEVKKRCTFTARLAVLSANAVYAFSGKLYRTFDGGTTWDSVQVSIPGNYRDSEMFFFNTNCGWITTENGTGGAMINDFPIVLTEDAGLSWSTSDLLRDGGIRCVYFVTDKVGWVSGVKNIYKTIDGGKHWTLEFSPDNGELFAKDMCFYNDKCGWVLNWNGHIYKHKNTSY